MLGVFNQRRVARIGQHLGDGLVKPSRRSVGATMAAAVTGHVATRKTRGPGAFYGRKTEEFRGANCILVAVGCVFLPPT